MRFAYKPTIASTSSFGEFSIELLENKDLSGKKQRAPDRQRLFVFDKFGCEGWIWTPTFRL
jgi:hypothetical protein